VAPSCLEAAEAKRKGVREGIAKSSNEIYLSSYVCFLHLFVAFAFLVNEFLLIHFSVLLCNSASRRTIRRRNHSFCRDVTVKEEVLQIFARHGIDAKQIRLLWMVPAGADVLHVLEINDPSSASSSQPISPLNLSERFIRLAFLVSTLCDFLFAVLHHDFVLFLLLFPVSFFFSLLSFMQDPAISGDF
jgi:hypothetical protein